MQARCKSGIGEERLTAFNDSSTKVISNSWCRVHTGKCCRAAVEAATASKTVGETMASSSSGWHSILAGFLSLPDGGYACSCLHNAEIMFVWAEKHVRKIRLMHFHSWFSHRLRCVECN